MISQMVYDVVLCINKIPIDRGVSSTLSTRKIIIGTTLDFNKHFKIEFVSYAKTH